MGSSFKVYQIHRSKCLGTTMFSVKTHQEVSFKNNTQCKIHFPMFFKNHLSHCNLPVLSNFENEFDLCEKFSFFSPPFHPQLPRLFVRCSVHERGSPVKGGLTSCFMKNKCPLRSEPLELR